MAVNRQVVSGSIIIGDSRRRTLLRPGLDLRPCWEFEAQESLRQALPHTATRIYEFASMHAVRWVLMSTNGGMLDPFAASLIRSHGEPTFAAENWQLYKQVTVPTALAPLSLCPKNVEARLCFG